MASSNTSSNKTECVFIVEFTLEQLEDNRAALEDFCNHLEEWCEDDPNMPKRVEDLDSCIEQLKKAKAVSK